MLMKTAAISALVLALSAGSLYAAPPHCPPGHAKKGECTPGGPAVARHDHAPARAHERDRARHHWQRGERISPDRYVVVDRWRDRGYPPPPAGHRYVVVDDEVLLVAIATNVIADVLLNR